MAKKKKTVAEADQMIPPPYWEYRRSPRMFLLCVKIFRKNIHLAPNVTEVLKDIANTVDSRATVKRKAQNDRFKMAGDLLRLKMSSEEGAVLLFVAGRKVPLVLRSIILGRRFMRTSVAKWRRWMHLRSALAFWNGHVMS